MHVPLTLLYIQIQKKSSLLLPWYHHTWTSKKYAPQIPHMPVTSCADIRQLYLYISHINPVLSTMWPGMLVYIPSHYWPMPPEQVSITLYIHVALHFCCSQHAYHTLFYTQVKNDKWLLYSPCYIHICPATNMSKKSYTYAT